jgi:hypothetical protein
VAKYNNTSAIWIKLAITAIVTLMLTGFTLLGASKLDKAVFELHLESEQRQFRDMNAQMVRVESKLDRLIEHNGG